MARKRWIGALAVLAAGASLVGPAAASADTGDKGYTFALIGDIPYGDAQLARFPRVIDQINQDPDVRFVTHLGDIKSGSSVCSDAYFDAVRADFDRFQDPLIYTVGDNEWTDCHRTNNGTYNPLERLARIRQVFFPNAGRTLGQHPMTIKSQARLGIPENVRFDRADVAFGFVHIVGSNNGLLPWPELGFTSPTPAQLAEVQARTSASVALIRQVFAQAREEDSRAVVIGLQADMFDPTVPGPLKPADWSGLAPVVQAIAQESLAWQKPVYLFNGDSHVFNVDQPLGVGSKWLGVYGLTAPVPNLTRVTVEGSTGDNHWVKVTVNDDDHPGADVLSFESVTFPA